MTSGSLWNYSREEINGVDDNASQDKFKTKIIGETPAWPPQPGNPGDLDWPAHHQSHHQSDP